MTRRKNTAKKLNLKQIIGEQDDLLRELVQQIVQQVLEAEMDEAVGAEKGERTRSRLGYRSGYYRRTLPFVPEIWELTRTRIRNCWKSAAPLEKRSNSCDATCSLAKGPRRVQKLRLLRVRTRLVAMANRSTTVFRQM